MQPFGLLLALVGLLLVLLLIGIRVELPWLKVDWRDKPPGWGVWPLAVGLFAGGLWLAFAAGRVAPAANMSAGTANSSKPAESGNAKAGADMPVANLDESRPVVREKAAAPRAAQASRSPTPERTQVRTAIADNQSVAVAGDVSNDSTVIAGPGGDPSERRR